MFWNSFFAFSIPLPTLLSLSPLSFSLLLQEPFWKAVTPLFKEKEKEWKGALPTQEYENIAISCVPSFLKMAVTEP